MPPIYASSNALYMPLMPHIYAFVILEYSRLHVPVRYLVYE